MACCWTRANTTKLPSKDSPFDKALLEGFNKVQRSGNVFRNNPALSRRRLLEGTFGLMIQLQESPDDTTPEGEAKRLEGFDDFTQANEAERILTLGVAQPGGGAPVPTAAFAPRAPRARSHVLLVPRCEERLPHVLTQELLLHGLSLLETSTRTDFRLLFDSNAEFAPVNHFHYHGLYLDLTGLPGSKFPIEKAERTLIAGDITAGRVAIELLQESYWYSRGFVLSAGCKADAQGPNAPADVQALALLVTHLVSELHRRSVPYSVVLAPPVELRQAKRSVGSMEAPVDEKPTAVTPEIFVLPRRPQADFPESAGIGATAYDLAGFVLARTEDAYCNATEASIKEVFSGSVACPAPSFDELICKAAWLSN
mmetsp:Transcript_99614/g.277352  ORF Transcript_99614/g.277352 Transcript_99614/m.277352 type:complete len:369 (-) Transcript_99614:126-1232(-)|eukprot:CAMPEP_0179060346 /NCGR_PEP_ID=MMETSP0796-20121207/25820_1 /TAXON_ID=73915 /ORGANISM="Pyrodinium bahamense, Strain pbaha01" /LENGTH=368 /DNA_ID=CAMNT_0020757129 /DNA_START=58 /DNA_END=1164 /DNA_ORIENTATION=+